MFYFVHLVLLAAAVRWPEVDALGYLCSFGTWSVGAKIKGFCDSSFVI